MTRSWRFLVGLTAVCVMGACQAGGPPGEEDAHVHAEEEGDEGGHGHGGEESWAVTSWGSQFEIFAEADPLIAGQTVNSHTHVTVLSDFSALGEGVVSAVLRDAGGREQVFTKDQALRDGIFDIAITPASSGEYELLFRVAGAGRTEEIPSGRVRVGTDHAPGGLAEGNETKQAAEAVSFLKEQQWNTRFSTAWVAAGEIHESARGTGLVRPASGGELHLAAPIDGIVAADPWPYVGLSRNAGDAVLAFSTRVAQGQTLAQLQAVETEKNAELGLARDRLARLEGLLEVGAVSEAEVDAARARVQTLEAQSESARRQMISVRGAGGGSGPRSALLNVTAPFSGEVAEVLVRPGQAVSAGDPLVRLVRVEPVWVEVYLSPADASRLEDGVSGLWIRTTGAQERRLFQDPQVRLVSISPEVTTRTGRVTCLLQVVTGSDRLRIGHAVEAEVLLTKAHGGIVISSSAIVDDAGIPTVFVQLDGESFERREISILGREGDRVLVAGLSVEERLVTAGGSAIRRASLISSGGAGHGHAH